MTVTTIDTAPTAIPTGVARGRGGGGPAPTRIVVAYGFWIFILSDIVMFSAADRAAASYSTCAMSSSKHCACCSRATHAGSGCSRPSGARPGTS